MAHAKYSPSSASIWMYCNHSAEYPSKENEYTIEGTIAHTALEDLFNGKKKIKYVNEEMKIYVNSVYSALRMMFGDKLKTECRSSICSKRKIFGTVDLHYHDKKNKVMHVIDFKYGRYRVMAEDNKQLILYAYGLVKRKTKSVDIVKLYISQPRIGNYNEVTYTRAEIIQKANKILKTLDKKTHKIGPWCKFCNGKDKCALQLAKRAT